MRITEELNKLSAIEKFTRVQVHARTKLLRLFHRSPEYIGQMILDYAATMPRGQVKTEVVFIGQTLIDNPELCYEEFHRFFNKHNANLPYETRRQINVAVREAVKSNKLVASALAKWKADDFPEVWNEVRQDE